MGFHDQALTNHNETRHLLQVGYVDRQVGLLLARLRRTGLFDQALIVVTADHGYRLRGRASKDRRLVTERERRADRAGPDVREGAGPDRAARWTRASCAPSTWCPRSPTCSTRGPRWRHDGRSAFAPVTRRRREVALPTRDFSRVIRIGLAGAARGAAPRTGGGAPALVGTGAESDLLFGSPWASLYRVGSHPELLGRRGERPAPAAPAAAQRDRGQRRPAADVRPG